MGAQPGYAQARDRRHIGAGPGFVCPVRGDTPLERALEQQRHDRLDRHQRALGEPEQGQGTHGDQFGGCKRLLRRQIMATALQYLLIAAATVARWI
ncbi:hypothetical protein GCM10028792_32850 [Salinisphaera aquimarina]